jgi:general secretion pathway protein K
LRISGARLSAKGPDGFSLRISGARLSAKGQDGFIVVAVLWIMLALATLASIHSVYVATSAISLSANDDAVQAEALVSAALELTAYRLSGAANTRPTRGAFRFRLARANVAVDFVSEAARIDLNSAPKALLAGLFAAFGAQPEAADQYADRILGWRTRPKPDAQNNEDSLYRTAGLLYSPRGAPFGNVGELWLVAGLPPGLVERAMPFVTIFSGRQDVNVLDAAPEVIAALPGMTPARLNAFLSERATLPPDPDMIAAALGGKQPGAGTRGSDAVRVTVRIAFDKGFQSATEAVIFVGSGAGNRAEPYRVLAWRDEAEAAPSSRRVTGGAR